MEEWRDIKGFEGMYQISSLGRVKSLGRIKWSGTVKYISKDRILKPCKHTRGYQQVNLCINGKRYKRFIHRLVAEAFINNIENKPCIDHLDGNKQNNIVSNLRWCTFYENTHNPITEKRFKEAYV